MFSQSLILYSFMIYLTWSESYKRRLQISLIPAWHSGWLSLEEKFHLKKFNSISVKQLYLWMETNLYLPHNLERKDKISYLLKLSLQMMQVVIKVRFLKSHLLKFLSSFSYWGTSSLYFRFLRFYLRERVDKIYSSIEGYFLL